jgi:ferredoxin
MSATPSRTDPTAELRVDRVRCTGHGICASLLPGGVRLDEWGYPVLLDRAAGGLDDGEPARAAAIRLCPAMALYRTSSAG